MKRLAGWLFVPVLGLGFCAAAPAPPAGVPSAAQLPGPVVGQPAPDFALTTIDGKRVRLADYRGRTLVVNVWGSWCPPCRLETPDLVAEAKRDAGKVAFLGVDTTETASVVRAFSAAKGIPYPQAVTTGTSDFARAYEIRNYPTTFVIDPRGVLRARHADNLLPAAQLRAYIAAAQRGENGVLTSAFQQQLDAMLAPAQYGLGGDAAGTAGGVAPAKAGEPPAKAAADPAAIKANVAKAAQAIAKVNELLDDAMDDPARDHDLIATQAEEQTLRAAAIAAFAPVASGAADQALLARLRGDEAAALGHWAEADAQYALALKTSPDDVETLGGQAYAVSHLGDDARVAQLDARIAALAPSYASYVGLGKALAKVGRPAAEVEAAFAKAQALAKTPAQLAWTNLYYGQTEANGHRASQARALFAQAAAAAERIPSTDPRREWYLERAQEGTVALAVAPGSAPALSLAPWTGPDLPGSIASTYKYRLIVTGAPGTRVGLAAAGLPRRWIGSFCTDRVCAPFRTAVTLPAAGVKVVEFQVVPTTAAAQAVNVSIAATAGGRTVARASTLVRV